MRCSADLVPLTDTFSINLLAFYLECCSLFGYAIQYFFSVVDRKWPSSVSLLTK